MPTATGEVGYACASRICEERWSMVTALQFTAIAVFLIWGLVSSQCDVLASRHDEAKLVQRRRGPAD